MKNFAAVVLLVAAFFFGGDSGGTQGTGKVEEALRVYPQLMAHDVFGACKTKLMAGEIKTATEEEAFIEKAAEQAYLTAMEYIAQADHEAYLGPDGKYAWTVEKAIAHRSDCEAQAARVGK